MKLSSWLAAGAIAIGAAVAAAACGGATSATAADAGTAPEAATASTCAPCTTNNDCNGALCAKFGSGTFCATSCETDQQCTTDMTCVPSEGSNGGTAGVCVPRGGVCGGSTVARDAGTDAAVDAGAVCSGFVGPTQSAACQCPTGKTCQANGCRYSEFCETSTKTCSPAPIGCGGTPGAAYDGGAPITGTIGASGGKVSRLYFAVVGDTRPPNEDDTTAYPTAIITKIFGDMEALSPKPSFAVSTGDYQYASPTGTQSTPQLDLYMGARKLYSNVVFPTMGNHECTGFTNSNCGQGNPDGITPNYTNYLQMFLGPINQTLPYYEIDIDAADGSWTSKFLFVAANAWTQTQADWLDQAMGRATTYTILVRHEDATTSTAPGVGPAQAIMLKHPYTLSLVGHTHTYAHSSGSQEVIIGNGGAPLGGASDYGFGMVSQLADGNLAVDMVDYASGLSDPTFRFVVKPDGSIGQ
jgi:hypothetical protein